MKFITEMDLRDVYKIATFTTYVVELDTKITPGARQFLVDLGVKITQATDDEGKVENTTDTKGSSGRVHWSIVRLQARMEVVESLFLLVGAEMLSCGQVLLGEEILILGHCFRNVTQAQGEGTPLIPVEFWGWPEEEIKKCANNIGKYFPVSECHIRLENGKVIALLNHLRASLREIEPAMLESYWDDTQEVCSRQELVDKVNLIINILCIMMWKCLGGQKCKP
jgi:ethanolamine utilization cobalamin adenosyltransferase